MTTLIDTHQLLAPEKFVLSQGRCLVCGSHSAANICQQCQDETKEEDEKKTKKSKPKEKKPKEKKPYVPRKCPFTCLSSPPASMYGFADANIMRSGNFVTEIEPTTGFVSLPEQDQLPKISKWYTYSNYVASLHQTFSVNILYSKLLLVIKVCGLDSRINKKASWQQNCYVF